MSRHLVGTRIVRGTRWILPVLAVGLCSCSATSWNSSNSGKPGTTRVSESARRAPREVVSLSSGGEEMIQQVSAEQFDPAPSARPYDVPASSPLSVVVSRSEPRVPLRETAALPTAMYAGRAARPSEEELARMYPDEYLFDGGDRGLPFHYENNDRAGFESEDTVGEFEDHLGNRRVKPSTRVAIYSPRFASVSTLTEPRENALAQAPAAADTALVTQRFDSRLVTSFHNEYNAPGGVLVRSRASGMDAEAESHGFDQSTNISLNDGLDRAIQNLQFLQSGRMNKADAAVIGEYVKNAALWTRNQSPSIQATTSAGMEVRATFKAMEIVGIEDSRKQRGDLRIVKLADKKVAQPGDVVTFTLRYDNLGDFELKNIRIVDNLTPRLEYIDGSATFEGPSGELLSFDNGEGSLILLFKIDGELDGGQGGVITFQTTVR
jgi:uncharacterized repeat protein (TIGR01451 family)